VSPREVNCWQKVWGGLIPTFKKAGLNPIRYAQGQVKRNPAYITAPKTINLFRFVVTR